MLDFPNAPTNGQLFTGANGVIYQWNAAGSLWLNYGVGMNNAIIASAPPANPVAGQLWWSPDLGQLFIYYNDGNSTQWVPASPNAALATQQGFRLLSRQVLGAVASVDLTNIPSDINELQCHFDLMPVPDNSDLRLNLYDNTGTLDVSNIYRWSYVLAYSNMTATTAPIGGGTTSSGVGTGFLLDYAVSGGAVSNLAGLGGIQGSFRMYNIRNANRVKHVNWQTSHLSQNQSYVCDVNGSGYRGVAGMITGLRLSFLQGNIADGTFEVWGSP
jgi:hypothetical protein